MADSIITNIIQRLSALPLYEYNNLKGVGDRLKSFENELKLMKEFLRYAKGKQQENLIFSELVDQIKEVAYEAEDTIETFILNVEKQRRRSTYIKVLHFEMHHKTANQINAIRTRIREIFDNKEKYGIEIGDGSMNRHFDGLLTRRRMVLDVDMVGFEDVANTLLKQLTQELTALEIISIVGMGGVGKTIVAQRLYNDQIIKDHFECHAWVSVSQDYNTHHIILYILNIVAPNKTDLEILETNQLKKILNGYLTDKKFIVFLDDVWQPTMWDEVGVCFPDNGNGSRIVITSRVANVARHAIPHFLRFLTPKESWELFERKVFRGDACPSILKSFGTKIVERCKGLPLTIVAIASMLACREKSERIWEMVLKDMSRHLENDEACLEILAFSFHNLPIELKPCLLYFAAFPEDHKISVRRLISLWVAEGFIQPLRELPLEVVAESYLDTLIDHSLVQAGIRRTDGGLKTCHVHDLVRELCIKKAKEENFLRETSKIHNLQALTSKCRHRRLSVHHYTTSTILSKEWDSSSVRTLLSFDLQLDYASAELWERLYSEYKLIRVLDLGVAVKVTTLPNEISSLANLRYLRFLLASPSIPESVFDLWNLEMLFIEGNQSLNVPLGSLLKLERLQQLVFTKPVKINGKTKASTPSSKKQLKYLKVLFPIYPDEDFESAVTNGLFSSLRKLSLCSFDHYSWSLKKLFTGLPDLQTLKICLSDIPILQPNNVFSGISAPDIPLSLTKMTLKSLSRADDLLCTVGQFPNLHILKLVDVQNTVLGAKKDSFPRVHTLHLDNINQGYTFGHTEAFAQLRYLFIKGGKSSIYARNLFKLPKLTNVEVLWPEPYLVDTLNRLQSNGEIKYKVLLHKDE